MEERINLIEFLKDCPKGMELDCTMYNKVSLLDIDYREGITFPIKVVREDGNSITLTKYGQYTNADFAKCIIFPKGKTTWQGFQRPFKDGDILTDVKGNIFIYKGPMFYNKSLADYYCGYRISDGAFIRKLVKDTHFGDISECRLATKEEKQRLTNIIKDKGFKWNPVTKILDKLIKFKVGDKIKHKSSGLYCTLGEYAEDIAAYHTNVGLSLTSKDLEEWELFPNKFDISTLKPFDEVLVRLDKNHRWVPQFFSRYDLKSINFPFECIHTSWPECIPYKGNEHLANTTNDCSDFYKIWE